MSLGARDKLLAAVLLLLSSVAAADFSVREAGARLDNGVFLVDAGVPHYDFRGLSTFTGLTPLRLQGASNAYVTDVALSDPNAPIVDIRRTVGGHPDG